MAQSALVLGQSYPNPDTLTTIYTVPGSPTLGAISSSLIIDNQGSFADNVKVSVAIASAANTATQYLYGGLNDYFPIKPGRLNGPFIATIGLTLAPTDVVRVYSRLGTTSFNLFGVQLS